MFGRKPKPNNNAPLSNDAERTLNLTENFSTLCVNKCITDQIEIDISHD